MSYIIEKTSPLFLTKITEAGRKAIATGKFNVKYFGVGDSEVDYSAVSKINLKILKPKDSQPDIKTFIQKGLQCESLSAVDPEDVNIVRGRLRNQAKERGFFNGHHIDLMELKATPDFIKFSGTTLLSKFDGTKTWDISGDISGEDFLLLEDGDIVLFKINNSYIDEVDSAVSTENPVPFVFFSITKQGALPEILMDRFLPFYSYLPASSGVTIPFYVFPKKESFLNFYSPSGQTISWNSETLEFYEQCFDNDVNIWNMNIPHCNTVAGTTGCTSDYENYGSYSYVGTMQYLGYCEPCLTDALEEDCGDSLSNHYYDAKDKVAILHFSNYNTRNQYGEYLYVDNTEGKTVLKLDLPSLMWHGRWFNGSALGDKMGMRFISQGDVKYVDALNENIKYIELTEDPQFISPDRDPVVVGKIYTELKIIVVEHPELIAAMSYKSNRNWTLPSLKGKMISPLGGINNGVLKRNKRLYMTYLLKAGNGITNTLPQQRYMVFDNTSNIDRDIEFQVEDVGLLPYMRQVEASSYDGMGFYAHKFVILYQITEIGESPVAANWEQVNFTNNVLTSLPNYTINPIQLENQIPSENNFILSKYRIENYSEGVYSNDLLCLGCGQSNLTMGDERFFFGNIQAYIGADVYKWIINILLDNSYVKTENDTYESGDFYFSELGFYNEDKELVVISKLSRPIRLRNGAKTEIEISLDF